VKLIYDEDGDVPAGMEGTNAVFEANLFQIAMRIGAEPPPPIFYTGGNTGRLEGRHDSDTAISGSNSLNSWRRPFQSTAIYLQPPMSPRQRSGNV